MNMIPHGPATGSQRNPGASPHACTSGGPLVVVTVDTEPDDAWGNHRNESVANVQQLPRFQRLLDRFGARATLLVTYRIIQSDAAVRVLERLVAECRAEIGAHLHPWENPPFLSSGLDLQHPTFPHELPLPVFAEKLAVLTDAIERRFGRPTSYRAGRWGMVAEHLSVLERLGYRVDTSVIPWIDWRPKWGIPRTQGGRGGVDYRKAPRKPYHPSYRDVARPGAARILEVPVTVAMTRRLPAPMASWLGRLPDMAQGALRKLRVAWPVWATPASEPAEHLTRMAHVALKESAPIINIALHSSELMVGGSPRSRSDEATDAIFQRIESLLAWLASCPGCSFATLSDAAAHGDGSAA